MAEQIRIDDGLKTFEIVNKDGDHILDISLNPSDTGIIARVNAVVEALNAYKPDGDDAEKAITEMDELLIQKMDDLLMADTRGTLFSKCAPLSMLDNGNTYIEEILNNLTPALEKITKTRAAKMEKRMAKYTAAYNK